MGPHLSLGLLIRLILLFLLVIMMEVEVVRLSSRGQLVIPQEIRKGMKLKEGEKLLVASDKHKIVIRPVKDLKRELLEELLLAKKADDAWEEIEKGEYKRLPKERFLEELSKW